MYLKNSRPQQFWIPALALPYTLLIQHSFEHSICVHIFRFMYTPGHTHFYTVTYNMLHVHAEASVYACTHTQNTHAHIHTHFVLLMCIHAHTHAHARMHAHTLTHSFCFTRTLIILDMIHYHMCWWHSCLDRTWSLRESTQTSSTASWTRGTSSWRWTMSLAVTSAPPPSHRWSLCSGNGQYSFWKEVCVSHYVCVNTSECVCVGWGDVFTGKRHRDWSV